jgi:hypothetical protein
MKKHQKEMQCLGPCGVPSIWEMGWDFTGEGDEPKPIWRCLCCHTEVKRQLKSKRNTNLNERTTP